MPSCVASGCDSRSNKGVLFKVFPRKDLRRRKIWIERVNLPGWAPTKYSALCERHFDHEQWEVPREDGKRKLKETAVPTIFCVEHPSSDDIVAKDHSYCILGYRQLYDSSDNCDKLSNECFTQFEHIKVEVDENSNFAMEEEQVEEVEILDEGRSEEAENIQCTPDIYTDPYGPIDPIEMVQCETNETNPNLMESSIDPLAISHEDMKQAANVVPDFQHTQKFLFIPKATKYVAPSNPPEVMGELAVDTQQPRLKVLSPEQLFQPINSSKLDLTPVSNTNNVLLSNRRPLPVLIPKVGMTLGKIASNVINNKTNLQSAQFNKNNPPLLSRVLNVGVDGNSTQVNNSLKAQRILSSLPPLVSTSQPLSTIFANSSPPSITSPPPLTPSPEFLKSAKVIRLPPNFTNKFINTNGTKKNLLTSSKSQILLITKKLQGKIKIKSKVESGFLKEFGVNVRKSNPISNSMEVCEKLEKVFLDHEYLDKPLWRPVSMDGMKMVKESSNKSVYRLIGNNDVKMWLTKNKADKADGHSKTSTKFKVMDTDSQMKSGIKKIDSVCISGSSLVVLDPFEKSKGTPGSSHIKLISSANRQKVNLFLCAICQSSFLTIASLKKHQSSHIESTTINKCISRSSSTDTADDDDIVVIEEKDVIKEDCKLSEEETETQHKIVVNESTEKCITNDSVNKLIPPNVKLKNLVICVPKLNLISETKSIKQNTAGDMKKCSPSERILRNRNRKYILRSKGKLIKTTFSNSKRKSNKKQIVALKSLPAVTSLETESIMKSSEQICKEPLLNIKANRKTTTENSLRTSKTVDELKLTSCGLFVSKKEPKEQSRNLSCKHLCDICDKRFTKKFLLQRHKTEIHRSRENKPFKCKRKKCKMMFTSKRQSEKHSKTCPMS